MQLEQLRNSSLVKDQMSFEMARATLYALLSDKDIKDFESLSRGDQFKLILATKKMLEKERI